MSCKLSTPLNATPVFEPVIAGQLSRFTRYYDAVVQFAPLPNDDGSLLRHVACAMKSTAARIEELPLALSEVEGSPTNESTGQRTAVLLNGNLNHDLDIEATLTAI